jgi:hypothetical protein
MTAVRLVVCDLTQSEPRSAPSGVLQCDKMLYGMPHSSPCCAQPQSKVRNTASPCCQTNIGISHSYLTKERQHPQTVDRPKSPVAIH